MSYSLFINGVLINRAATNTELVSLTAYQRGGIPSLSFRRKGYVLATLPDPWDAQPCSLTRTDPITGDVTTVFSGNTVSALLHYVPGVGWVREWSALGLLQAADYIPVTDSNTNTDVSLWDQLSTDPNAIPSREGRTIGQIVADVLEQPSNKARLIAAGIGNYTSPSGSGAEASVTVSGGVIIAVVIDNGGSGYSSAPTIFVAGGGGSGAVLTPTLTGGSISAIAITAAGSGYTTTPTLVFSTLPADTISDLNALTVIPPYQVSISGERLLAAVESTVANAHPNQVMQVEPSGDLRFLDQRTFTGTTLTMDGTDPRVGQFSLSIDWKDCYSQVEVRGQTRTQGVTVGVQPAPGSVLSNNGLIEDFAHDGLSNAEAIAVWSPSDFAAPGQPSGQAAGLANTSGGKVTSITVANSGYGYTVAPSVLISGGGGSGATATATISGGGVTGFTITNQGSGYTAIPNATVATPAGAGQSDLGTCTETDTTHVVIQSSNAAVSWPADYWDQTESGRHGMIVLSSDVITDVTQKWQCRVVSNTALEAGGTCTLTIDQPVPALDYNSYQLYGVGGGSSLVWRQYQVVNPAIGAAMQNYFPYPFALANADGTAATLTNSPTGTILWSSNGLPPYQEAPMGFTVDPDSSTITFYKPVSLIFGGGSVVTPPYDVQAFLAVANGLLQAFAPSSTTYDGTSYTTFGIERTKVITLRDWTDYSNQSNMNLFASEYLDSVKDVFVEGTIPYYGELPQFLTMGSALSLDAAYTTGFESAAIPIVQLNMEFHEDQDGATSYTTTLHISNRREKYSGDLFVRPSITGAPYGAEEFALNEYTSETVGQDAEGHPILQGKAEGGGVSEQLGAVADYASEGSMPADTDFEQLGIDPWDTPNGIGGGGRGSTGALSYSPPAPAPATFAPPAPDEDVATPPTQPNSQRGYYAALRSDD